MASAPVHHEKQGWNQLCLLHAINCLFQEDAAQRFSNGDLDRFAYELSPGSSFLSNPHKSMWNTGNYDVNILMFALSKRGYDTSWWDARRALKDLLTDDRSVSTCVRLAKRRAGRGSYETLCLFSLRRSHTSKLAGSRSLPLSSCIVCV